MTVGLGHYLAVAAILFTLGILGIFINRKNVIVILMSIELILLAVNINFVAFSTHLGDIMGQVFALLVLTVAAAEAAIGLAILVVYFRNRGSIAVEDVNLMRLTTPHVSGHCLAPVARRIVAGADALRRPRPASGASRATPSSGSPHQAPAAPGATQYHHRTRRSRAEGRGLARRGARYTLFCLSRGAVVIASTASGSPRIRARCAHLIFRAPEVECRSASNDHRRVLVV